MEPGSAPALASDGNEDEKCLMTLSITELISNLRTAFRRADYDRVEEVLVAKETKLKAEIGSLDEKLEMERLERMNVEEQLKKCKEKCEKGKNAEERYEKLLEAVNKKNDLDDGNTIAELRIKNLKLKDEKRRAESIVESWKRKFEELNERLLMVENGAKSFMNGDTHVGIGGNAEELSGVRRNTDPGVSTKVLEEKEMKEVDIRGRGCGNVTADSSPSQRQARESGNTHLFVGEGSEQSPATPNKAVLGASANGGSGLQKTVIEIEDSDDDECISSGTLNGKEATPQIVAAVNDNRHPCLSGSLQQKSLPSPMGVNDVSGILKRKWFSGSGNSSGGFSKNSFGGCDTDDDTSTSSIESEFNAVQLPSNFLRNTIDKRRKT